MFVDVFHRKAFSPILCIGFCRGEKPCYWSRLPPTKWVRSTVRGECYTEQGWGRKLFSSILQPGTCYFCGKALWNYYCCLYGILSVLASGRCNHLEFIHWIPHNSIGIASLRHCKNSARVHIEKFDIISIQFAKSPWSKACSFQPSQNLCDGFLSIAKFVSTLVGLAWADWHLLCRFMCSAWDNGVSWGAGSFPLEDWPSEQFCFLDPSVSWPDPSLSRSPVTLGRNRSAVSSKFVRPA